MVNVAVRLGAVAFSDSQWSVRVGVSLPFSSSLTLRELKFSNSVNCIGELSKTASSSPASGIFISLLQCHRL